MSRSINPLLKMIRCLGVGVRPARRVRASGYLLLEALIATTLMVLGLAVIGAQVQKAYFESMKMERLTRAMMLAESKLAELDTGLVDFNSFDEEMEEPFGPLFPDFGYRIRVQPTVTEGLNQVRLQILYFARNYHREDFDFDRAEVLYDLYTFRMAPRPIDLQADYGMDEESISRFNDLMAAVGAEYDGYNFPLQDFMRTADIEAILQLLSDEDLLQSLGGFSREEILSGLPREVQQALKELEGQLAGGGGRGEGGGRRGGTGGGEDEDDEDDDE